MHREHLRLSVPEMLEGEGGVEQQYWPFAQLISRRFPFAFHGLREPDFDLSPADGLKDEGSRNFSAGTPVLADPVTDTSTAGADLTAAWERMLSTVAAASTLSLA